VSAGPSPVSAVDPVPAPRPPLSPRTSRESASRRRPDASVGKAKQASEEPGPPYSSLVHGSRFNSAGVRTNPAGSPRRVVRHGRPIVVAGLLLFAGCGSEPAPVAEQAPPPNADERRLVREYNALLRGVAIDVRLPGAECTTLPRRTRAELRDSPQRVAAARARLARLRLPNSYDRVRTRLDEGLRLIAEANKLLLAWAERSDDPETGECGQSTDNLRDNAYDEFHDLAKPHLQAFMAKHNPIAAQMRATTWELGAAGLIPR
jgi:hypothetical protein